MQNVFRILAALLLAASLSGCGVRTAYNNLDWLTVRWVNQQVSLDRQQEALLRAGLDDLLTWHCATQLAGYQDLVEQIRLDLLSDRLDQARLAEHGEAIAVFGRALTERSVPLLVELATTLDDTQVAQVLAAFDERTDKVRVSVEEKSLGDLAEDRFNSMDRTLRRFMGRSNRAQQQRLAVWADSVTATEAYQLTQRLYWQDRLATALASRHDRDFLSEEMAALMRPESAWSDEYRAVMEGNRVLTLAALEDVLSLADTRHVNRLSARLTTLQQDFQRLSCEDEPVITLLAGASSRG